ncbi:hypothetical protein BH20ACI4_BH20ACI4_33160 [soil metagenome]
MQNNNHKILGVIFLCEFAIMLLLVVFFLVILGTGSLMAALNASTMNTDNFLGIVIFYSSIVLLYGILISAYGIGGWKLYKNKSGAKGWGVVASLFSIFFFFPIGLLISILGFILLFVDFGNNNRKFNNQRPYNNPPQPPQNWR